MKRYLLLALLFVSQVSATDALIEVNIARARRGLPAFIHDVNLYRAAEGCAQFRADRRIKGHTPNDFAALPPGTLARSAGCGAMETSWGWQSCCTFDRHTYAGAAVVIGRDGQRYMHIFVR